jgi:hypothetical protein
VILLRAKDKTYSRGSVTERFVDHQAYPELKQSSWLSREAGNLIVTDIEGIQSWQACNLNSSGYIAEASAKCTHNIGESGECIVLQI